MTMQSSMIKTPTRRKVTPGQVKAAPPSPMSRMALLSASSTDAVNGKQLYNEQQAREAADKAITEKVTNNTNEITKIKNGDFTDASKTVIKNWRRMLSRSRLATALRWMKQRTKRRATRPIRFRPITMVLSQKAMAT